MSNDTTQPVRVSTLRPGARIKYFGTEHVVQDFEKWEFKPGTQTEHADMYRLVLRCLATGYEQRIFVFGADVVHTYEHPYELRVRTSRIGTVRFRGPVGLLEHEQLQHCWEHGLRVDEYESETFIAGVVTDE